MIKKKSRDDYLDKFQSEMRKTWNFSLWDSYSNKQKTGLVIIGMSVLVCILAIAAIFSMLEPPQKTMTHQERVNSAVVLSHLSWNQIGKIWIGSYPIIINMLIISVGIGWILHGVGFVIIRR